MKMLLISNHGVHVEDSVGASVGFASIEELKKFSGTDVAGTVGNFDVCYEPERGIHVWTKGLAVENRPIPFALFEEIIQLLGVLVERKADKLYGLSSEQALAKALEYKLSQIDSVVQLFQGSDFVYQGKTFYSDPDFIHKTLTRVERLPDHYQLTWKTADKKADGISNIYTVMTKTQFQDFADFMYDLMASYWFIGDAKKTQVKAMVAEGATAEQIMAYDHTSNW